MAGVMASFATLGDVIVAEPGALIGFAGPRVIKETTQQDLPEGFQRAEFLQQHGLIDMVVSRKELRDRMILLLDYLCDK
jgi:acetyl-CoA carboxylase carboxyl transferase subunit beta